MTHAEGIGLAADADLGRMWRARPCPVRACRTISTSEVEAAKFDPWNALAAHRPLGDVMRAQRRLSSARRPRPSVR